MAEFNDFFIVIPARYDSSRFPGKVLAKIDGKSMLEHVFNNSLSSNAKEVFIATDSKKIYESSKNYTDNVFMTSKDNINGTERIAELAKSLNWHKTKLVINVQADQPFLKSDNINFLANSAGGNKGLSTLYYPLNNLELKKDKNTVKISLGKDIKFHREVDINENGEFYKHIGIYAYYVNDLINYNNLPQSSNEISLSLEQYRFVDNDIKIHAYLAKSDPGISIDSIENLDEYESINHWLIWTKLF